MGAYEELVRRHTQTAFRTAVLITGSAADAEEAVQDAFVKAHRALPRFRVGGSFRPWLLRIAGNEARNRRRAGGRRERVALRLGAIAASGPEPGPEAQAIAAEERAGLLAALHRLSEDDQLVIGARHLLQLSVEETAALLGIAEGTVKSRLSRALVRLRTLLEVPGA